MSIVSIRLPDKFLQEVDAYAEKLHLPRNQYILKALEILNKEVKKKILICSSFKVRKESMKINAEFSDIEHDPDA